MKLYKAYNKEEKVRAIILVTDEDISKIAGNCIARDLMFTENKDCHGWHFSNGHFINEEDFLSKSHCIAKGIIRLENVYNDNKSELFWYSSKPVCGCDDDEPEITKCEYNINGYCHFNYPDGRCQYEGYLTPEDLLTENDNLKVNLNEKNQENEELRKLLKEIDEWLIRDCGKEGSNCEFNELDCPDSDLVSCETADIHEKINKKLSKNKAVIVI
jgi:hypothetical protein